MLIWGYKLAKCEFTIYGKQSGEEMNSCILMVDIYSDPQLRHTPDGLDITDMIVQVPGYRSDDPPHPLKVVSLGNLAKEIHQKYHQGDRVIIEGRLGMHTFDTPQGFKEKRAEFTVQRIYAIGQNPTPIAATTAAPTAAPRYTPAPPPEPAYYPPETYEPARTAPIPTANVVNNPPPATNFEPTYQPNTYQNPSSPVVEQPDEDDIPF
ncbi:MAG TPA: single-stranded DNA-binding protein [Nostocaceae cyanobacterium]|nr:single-stranded DNA-binding protein [Nostocaceae cyanobacterium]